MHFGGEGLNTTATIYTYGSATSRPKITKNTYFVSVEVLQYIILCILYGLVSVERQLRACLVKEVLNGMHKSHWLCALAESGS